VENDDVAQPPSVDPCPYEDITGTCCYTDEADCTGICFGIGECIGCTDPEANNYDPGAVVNDNCIYSEKSYKRGLAFNLLDTADFEAIQDGVSWWYNWYYETDVSGDYYSNHLMEFIPMLWGGTSDNDIDGVMSYILGHSEIKYLLVLNEPNLTDQANRTPSIAALDWVIYEQVIADLADLGRTVYLVGPAMNWGTMTDYEDPIVWLDAFYDAYRSANGGDDPKIDYLAFHWYDYGLATQLDRLQKYGKQIWVTEMANWNANIKSYEDQIQQMQEMVSICENRDDVFRYAWFYGRTDENWCEEYFTCLFGPDPGELTPLGQSYINLPYTDEPTE